VESAAAELVRNARDAGARNVYVASTLRRRRYRTLTVLDDGRGIPEPYREAVFEPGVTTRHLQPTTDSLGHHGAGLSLYHIRQTALRAELLSASDPTALRVTFDTRRLPERTLQAGSRPSSSNLRATLAALAEGSSLHIYLGSPSAILARLIQNRIIQVNRGEENNNYKKRNRSSARSSAGGVADRARALGLEVSLRTVQRVLRGEVAAAGEVRRPRGAERGPVAGRGGAGGPVLRLSERDLGKIRDILQEAAGASYLALDQLEITAGPGTVTLRARVYQPEEEYE
jgi:hypothetical protein